MGSLRPIFDSISYRIAQPNRKAVRRYTAIDSLDRLQTYHVHMTARCEKTSLICGIRPYSRMHLFEKIISG